MKRGRAFAAWLLPGLAVSAAVSLVLAAFSYHWQHPEMTEMQVLQDVGSWWRSCWLVAVVLMLVYTARSWHEATP